MRANARLIRGARSIGLVALLVTGCSRAPDNTPLPADVQALRELAAAYRDFGRAHRRGPKDLAELQFLGPRQGRGRVRGKTATAAGQAMPNAIGMIRSGDLVVQWGAPLSPPGAAPDAVLAYFRSAPEQGGDVLMQDADTIRAMTADQFKAAPRAAAH
jgi:hypothetical protein